MLARKTVVVTVIGMAGLSVFPAGGVLAYSCRQPRTLEEELQQATVIFVGEATSVREVAAQESEVVDELPIHYEVEFQVKRSWRGIVGPTVMVAVPYLGGTGYGSCGVELKTAGQYLVFAYGEDRLRTNIQTRGVGACSRTRHVTQAGEDLEKLDEATTSFGGAQ